MNDVLENLFIELAKEAWKNWGSASAMRDDITIVIGFLGTFINQENNYTNNNNKPKMSEIKVKSSHINIS